MNTKHTIQSINAFISDFLDVEAFPMDGAVNGINVSTTREIKKIVGAVSPSLELFQRAKDANADVIVTHHALERKPETLSVPLQGPQKGRVDFLQKNNIGMLSYHLPLDYHEEIGNNALMLKKFAVDKVQRVGTFIGLSGALFVGSFDEARKRNDVLSTLELFLDRKLDTELFGSEQIKTIAVVTGAGCNRELLDMVVKENIDMYVTGEIKEELPYYAKETQLNFVCGGHYATEVCGVKALLNLANKAFPEIATEFIDLPVHY